jgi:hypothetical protein
MPLSEEVIAARVRVRVCELKVMAARVFARTKATECFPLPFLPGPAPARRPPRRAMPGGRREGGGSPSS